MFQKIKLFLVMVLLFSAISLPLAATYAPQPVSAQAAAQIKKGVQQAGGDKNKRELPAFFEIITNILLFLIGAIAVIAIVISAIRFVTANGNQEQIKSARDGILYSVIGIVAAFMAYAIVRFVVNNLK